MTLLKGSATFSSTQPQNPLPTVFGARRRSLYEGGPLVSLVGFGTYRVGSSPSLGAPESGQALEHALRKGINLIDTSSNYGNGQSEVLIGKALAKLVLEKQITRESVVVVSKGGYIQGNNLELAQKREQDGSPFPEVTKFGEGVWHCIHPEFLADQLDRSLARLQLETLDVFLLHNPEYMLKKFEMDNTDPEQAQELFYARMAKSFEFLETCVASGKIKAYGVSSNTMGYANEDYSAVSLSKLIAIAQSISTQNHFKVVQFPMNWIEVAPVALPVNDEGNSTVDLARASGMGVLINRPFNAMHNNGLIRLTRPTVPVGVELDPDAQKGLANWTKLALDLEALGKKHLENKIGYDDAPLSQIVLATLMWQPGVTSVLCGARKLIYLKDLEEACARPAIVNAASVLASIYDDLEFHRD